MWCADGRDYYLCSYNIHMLIPDNLLRISSVARPRRLLLFTLIVLYSLIRSHQLGLCVVWWSEYARVCMAAACVCVCTLACTRALTQVRVRKQCGRRRGQCWGVETRATRGTQRGRISHEIANSYKIIVFCYIRHYVINSTILSD